MSAQRRLCLILLLTAAGVGCGESPTGPSDEPVTFSGRLLDYVTQAPIAGAPLSFSLQSVAGTLNPSSTTTTADGAYTITVPRTGEYVIRIDASPVRHTKIGRWLWGGGSPASAGSTSR
jgi:hypothetical protein